MSRIFAMSVVVVLLTGTANATNFWLSEAGMPSGSAVGEVPAIRTEPGNSNQINIYARPDPDAILENWHLNLISSTPGVIAFTGYDIVNPYLGNTGATPNKDVFRYEFENDSATGVTIANPNALESIKAFTVAHDAAITLGLGENARLVKDPAYDVGNDAWLLVVVDYDVIGPGHTNLFLEIGQKRSQQSRRDFFGNRRDFR